MIAIVTGFFLVAYLLGPGAIYRVTFGLFTRSKRFQRSRTEEVVFSVFATSIPFAITWLLLCHTPLGRFPNIHSSIGKDAAYKAIVNALTSDKTQVDLSGAYLRALKEQARFVSFLWALCAVEAIGTSSLLRRYGDLPDRGLPTWLCEKLFLVHVSEWQILFTTDFLPSSERNKCVEVDVLTSGDMLYRGRVTDWFVDNDGKLLGLFLTDADRFRREDLEHDREANLHEPTEGYWKAIPGSNLYIQASSILNYNVRYVESRDARTTQAVGHKVRVTAFHPTEDKEDIGL